MNTYLYDAKTNAFYPLVMQDDYEAVGMWPEEGVNVDEDVFKEFQNPPEGKIRSADSKGNPSWIDAPKPPNEHLLTQELLRLSTDYKSDMEGLNAAYLAAIVSDGPSEEDKQKTVRDQISERKAKYSADIAEAKNKYPV